jgi:hypothetical protein
LSLSQVDLAMAQGAMLQFQISEFTLQCLVLACLTLVVLLCQNALSTGYTRREVTATLFATYVTIHEYCYWYIYWTYYSVILALQSFLGQLNSFFCLSTGGCLLNKCTANISYCSLSF